MKIGIIGYGRRAEWMADTIRKADSSVRIAAVTDIRNEQIKEQLGAEAEGVRFYTDPDTMLSAESLDGVMIGTRCSLHTKMAVKVLKTGLPLFLEKPVAVSFEDFSELKQAYESSRSEVVVSFPLRCTTIVQLAKEIVDSGKIGAVDHVQAVNNVPYGGVYFQNWYRDEKETGGLFLQKATHDFDYISYLIGSNPVQVCAMHSKQIFKGSMTAGLKCVECELQEDCPESAVLKERNGRLVEGPYCAFAEDTGNEDSGSAIIRYETGMHAVYSQNFFTRRESQARGARLIGYKGTLEFDFYTGILKVMMHHAARTETHDFKDTGNHFGGDAALAENFINVMKGKETSKFPLEAGLFSAMMCLKARLSAETGTFQNIEMEQHSAAGGIRA